MKIRNSRCRRFDTVPACDGRTDGRTDTSTMAVARKTVTEEGNPTNKILQTASSKNTDLTCKKQSLQRLEK